MAPDGGDEQPLEVIHRCVEYGNRLGDALCVGTHKRNAGQVLSGKGLLLTAFTS